MIKKLYFALIPLAIVLSGYHFFIKSCKCTSPNKKKFASFPIPAHQIRPFIFVQLGNHPWLLEAQNRIKPVIDRIIQEELRTANEELETFPEFYLKQRNLITLFYSKEVTPELEPTLVNIFKMLDISNCPKIETVAFTTDTHLFGKEGSELIIKIEDPAHSLPKARQFFVDFMNNPQEEFDGANLHEALQTDGANRFEFAPHETLGRIPIDEIEKLSDKETVQRIQKLILEKIPKTLETIEASPQIEPEQIEIYGNNFKSIYAMVLEKE